jgi:hypothetical protein
MRSENMALSSFSTCGQPMPIFPPEPDPLFSQRSLATLLRDQIQRMENHINQYADDLFLQNSSEDWIDTISDDAALPPLVLHLDKGVSHPPVEVTNFRVDVNPVPISGFRYAVEIPYGGPLASSTISLTFTIWTSRPHTSIHKHTTGPSSSAGLRRRRSPPPNLKRRSTWSLPRSRSTSTTKPSSSRRSTPR